MAPRAGKRRAQALPEWSRHPHLAQPSGLGRGRKWAPGRLGKGAHPGPGREGAPLGGRGAAPAGPGDLGRKWVDSGSAADRQRARRSAPSSEVTGHRVSSGWLGKHTETEAWGGAGWGAGLRGLLAAIWQPGLPGSGRAPGQHRETLAVLLTPAQQAGTARPATGLLGHRPGLSSGLCSATFASETSVTQWSCSQDSLAQPSAGLLSVKGKDECLVAL